MKNSLLQSFAMLESKFCIVFIPRYEQEDYANFLPGER